MSPRAGKRYGTLLHDERAVYMAATDAMGPRGRAKEVAPAAIRADAMALKGGRRSGSGLQQSLSNCCSSGARVEGICGR